MIKSGVTDPGHSLKPVLALRRSATGAIRRAAPCVKSLQLLRSEHVADHYTLNMRELS
jgi:hypothetical protein